MTKILLVKTNRTRCGEAKAEIHRFMNYSENKIKYSFKFYSTHKFFNTYKELREIGIKRLVEYLIFFYLLIYYIIKLMIN